MYSYILWKNIIVTSQAGGEEHIEMRQCIWPCVDLLCVLTVAGDSEDAVSQTAATLNLQSDETEKWRLAWQSLLRECLSDVPGGHLENLLVS